MRRTWCFSRSSLLSGEVMCLRRSDEGAPKCAARLLRREEETSVVVPERGRLSALVPSWLCSCHSCQKRRQQDAWPRPASFVLRASVAAMANPRRTAFEPAWKVHPLIAFVSSDPVPLQPALPISALD